MWKRNILFLESHLETTLQSLELNELRRYSVNSYQLLDLSFVKCQTMEINSASSIVVTIDNTKEVGRLLTLPIVKTEDYIQQNDLMTKRRRLDVIKVESWIMI